MLWAIGTKAATWFFGGGLSKLGQIGVDLYRTKLTAENTTEKHVADLAARAIDLDQREAELNSRVLVAEQGNWLTRSVRPMWAMPFIIYTWFKVVFDICLGWMHVPELHDTASTMCVTIIVSYFGSRGLEKLVDKWAMVRMVVTGKRGA